MRLRVSLPILLFMIYGLLAQEVEQNNWNETLEQLSSWNTLGTDEYRLGRGDLIEIKVFGVEEFNQTYRISPSGNITIPLLGTVPAAGQTQEGFQKSLAELLAQKKLVLDPQVTVHIKEYQSQPVYVLGAVNQPGQYMVTHQLSLIDAIGMAGGLDLTRASDTVLLQQRAGSPTGANSDPNAAAEHSNNEVTKIDLRDLLERGDLSLNVPIKGGDVIHVPEREVKVFYVVGDVVRPGAFELPEDEAKTLYLTQALAKAGGAEKTAKMSKGQLVRYEKNGSRNEMTLDFGAIMKGKSPDIPIQANDVLFVPGSNAKTIGYGLLGIIPTSVSRAVLIGAVN